MLSETWLPCLVFGLVLCFRFLRLFENMRRQDLEIPRELLESGQRHLELDETTLKSTGKSVSVDDVIARIDEALDA